MYCDIPRNSCTDTTTIAANRPVKTYVKTNAHPLDNRNHRTVNRGQTNDTTGAINTRHQTTRSPVCDPQQLAARVIL
jgi:hypothetical protein